jgi:N-acetylated-alpha-linked acidic dipeptidase
MSLVAMSGRLTLASLLAVSSATAQESQAAQSSPTISGFAEAVIPAQRAFEQTLLDAIQPDSVGRWARTLAMRPHVAGTQGQVATRDSVIGWHMAAGIDAGYDSLMLYMPHPLLVSVERTWPEPMVFDLAEPPIAGDPATGLDVVPVFNAYSGSGVAAAEVVFAGYGLPADYRTLDSAGVSVEGKVVLARYGRSFRGIKAREAEARGAVGLLLYSDPENDGFVRGEVYPDGPMRPARGVQRGSVLNATGDPSTPTVPSLLGAPRVPEEQMVGVARIPVVPIGYEAAEALLQPLGGPEAPESWQGGLDLTYRFGPGPTRARVEVRTESGEAAYHSAYNTIAVVDGADWPDEWVVIGAHRDAWSPGAIDNASGTASVVEVARAFGAAAALGMRPRRTVVFATWDAEEWGIIGSIEWVEAHAERLRASVVAYVNQDAPVSGSSFGAASSPELKSLAREVARRVDDPARAGTVYDSWLTRVTERLGDSEIDPEPLPVGDLGGGSDHKGFYQHLGIPAMGFGFGGAGGVYHSMYDTPRWMQEYGDPGYLYHAAAARVAAVMVSRLANADILPYDFVELAEVVRERADHLESEVESALVAATATEHAVGDAALEVQPDSPISGEVRAALQGLWSSVASTEEAAAAYSRASQRWLAQAGQGDEIAGRVNQHLRAASLSLASDRGLPGDEWSRQLLFASDPDNGYATLPMPAVRLALRSGDLEAVADRIEELARHLATAASHLAAARAVLEEQGVS